MVHDGHWWWGTGGGGKSVVDALCGWAVRVWREGGDRGNESVPCDGAGEGVAVSQWVAAWLWCAMVWDQRESWFDVVGWESWDPYDSVQENLESLV